MKNPLYEFFDADKGKVINSDDVAATIKHTANKTKMTAKKVGKKARLWYRKQQHDRQWWDQDI